MLARGSLLVAALCAMSLSGCLNPAALLGQSSNHAATNVTATNQTGVVSVLPDNRTGTSIAYQETNMTDTMGMHSHDYWNGRTRVDLFAEHAALGPAQNPAFPDAWGTIVDIRPPSGHTVFEGTAQLEVTVTNPTLHACDPTGDWYGNAPICTDNLQAVRAGGPPVPDPQPSSSLHLFYVSAADNLGQWHDAGPLVWNTPLVVKITDPKMTDMPHAVGSLWVFRIASSDPKDSTLQFDVKATIVRGDGSIPLWPGHPIFYARTHYRLVADSTGEAQDTYNEGNGGPVKVVYPEKLISAGTNTVIVFVNVTSLTAAPVPSMSPYYWTLVYHNASYTNLNLTQTTKNDTVSDHKTFEWVVRMDPNGMDGPYATQSRWGFYIRGVAGPTSAQPGCWAGCATYDVKYTVQVVASDLFPAAYSVSLNGGQLYAPGN
jgi:hypothetical protein